MVENTPDDPRKRKPDISKAKSVLGWEPKVEICYFFDYMLRSSFECLVLVFSYSIDGLTGDTSGGTPVNGRRLQRTSYVNKKAVKMLEEC